MRCFECENLAAEYERRIREHDQFIEEYHLAVAVGDTAKMWELRLAVSGSRLLGIRARDRLNSHRATHEQKALTASA
jgi:hypothetical protein